MNSNIEYIDKNIFNYATPRRIYTNNNGLTVLEKKENTLF